MRNLDYVNGRKVEDFLGCRGSAHLIGSLLLILALIGAGYLYSSYKEKKLASDVPN
jgi:hypothetical protein